MVNLKKSKTSYKYLLIAKNTCIVLLPVLLLCIEVENGCAQSLPAKSEVPNWALPGSATHKQIPPPLDFHRPAKTDNNPIGIFKGQSDVGAALVSGSSTYNSVTKQYTINSAGYNIWYSRDEFRFLWKKMSGDVSLAADVTFPDPTGYGDRKAVVIIRQSLDDDSKEAMVALHGGGLLHLAWRPGKNEDMKEMRVDLKSLSGNPSANDEGILHVKRIGIEKHGDEFSIFVSVAGEPMHRYGAPVHLHIDGPFYVGIGFCSHQPDKADTAILSDVVLESGAVKLKE
ncbi:MAG: hypothetical protein JWP44_377 [Mucilaginibacter sp.]|nr:hypothetical protein [Mucilaginibacter sp.]